MRWLSTAIAVPQPLSWAVLATSRTVMRLSAAPSRKITPSPVSGSGAICSASGLTSMSREAKSSSTALADLAASTAEPPPQYTPRVACVHTS